MTISFVLDVIAVVVDYRVSKKIKTESYLSQGPSKSIADIDAEVELSRHENKVGLKYLPKLFWFFILSFVLSSNSAYGFTNVAVSYLAHKWFSDLPLDQAEVKAGQQVTIIWITACATCILFGKLVNDYGYRSVVVVVAPILIIASHLSLIYFESFLSLVALGLTLAIFFSGVVVSVQIIIPVEQLGFAYGVFFTFQNLGLVTTPVIVGF